MSIHSQLPYDRSTSHARIPAGGINLIESIDSACEAQVTASFFGSTKALHGEVATTSAETSTHNHSNQQFSITAVTTSAGAIAERHAYSAYGEPTICDSAGSAIGSSAINNRYSYTGREWDATVGLYHFRARWMSPKTGRFLGRDPTGYNDGFVLYLAMFAIMSAADPSGLELESLKMDCNLALASMVYLDATTDFDDPRALEQLQRGPRIFCGNCGFQNYSWLSPDDGRCNVCLNGTGPKKFYDDWIAILIHELTHCDQYGCKGRKAPPEKIDPIPLVPPRTFPGTPGQRCKACRQNEEIAYEAQCGYLYPGPKNNSKRKACIDAGKCNSCEQTCRGVTAIESECEGKKFPVFVPPILPPK